MLHAALNRILLILFTFCATHSFDLFMILFAFECLNTYLSLFDHSPKPMELTGLDVKASPVAPG